MFDKKVINNITKEARAKTLTLGKENIIVLRVDYNLSDEQYEHLKNQLNKHNTVDGIEGVKFIILEGEVKLDCVLSKG
jgi:hypothetical protein